MKSAAGDDARLVSAVDEPRPLSATWHIRPMQLASVGVETELLNSTHCISPPRPGRGKPKSRSVKGPGAKEPRLQAQCLHDLPGRRRRMGNLN